jgi:putative ABC transport system permease protein
LRVAGLLLSEHQQIGLMDIAAAQWKLGKLGKLTRIDVKLKQGADRNRFLRRLRDALPPGVVVEQPEGRAQSAATATRAYRVNLNVLALVALFTGGLLVLSTQSLSVARRRGELALLRVLGARRADVLRLIVVEAAGLGLAGAVLGIVVGWLLAALVLHWTGGDLGSGHFSGFAAQLHFDFFAASLHAVLGVTAAVAGSLPPALEAARTPPAQALKSGDEPAESRTGRPAVGGSLLVLTGAALTLLPAVNDLPLFAYASIACLLLGTIVLMPTLTRFLLARLPSRGSVTFQLALRQLASSPGKMAVSLAAIVAAVSLAVAMAIMVGSFRDSVTGWLERMLPADLYVRAGAGSEIALFTREDQERLRTLKGVRVVEFLRARQVMVDAQRMPVSLMARDFLHADPSLTLPLVGSPAASDSALPPLWVSEVAAGLYHWTPGMTVRIPLDGAEREFRVAGIWRDYGRQNGALLMDRRTYVAMTGDDSANDAGLWLDSAELSHQVSQAIVALWPAASGLETATPAEVRTLSLRIFDRSFAVTYGLEAAAVMIGLLALTGSIATQLAARRREFGMLRHVGMTRGQLNSMLIWEGALVNALGIAVGCTLGWLISLILIHVVNRQSFHWSMEMHVPWHTLVTFAASLLLLGVLTAAWAGRQAVLGATIRAVKEDW